MLTDKQNQLREIKQALRQGGGDQAVGRQHAKGKMTARERVEKLLDPGSFVETGLFVKHRSSQFGMEDRQAPGDGVVTGYGTIDGRPVCLAAQDFTVIGGSLGEMHADKIVQTQELAMKIGAPMIAINDSGGARIQEGVDSLAGYGRIFYNNTKASGVIPQLSVIMGPCAGGAVYSPALTDFVFMVDDTSEMFITGPQVIKAVTGEEVSAQTLGGSMTHNSVSGVAHFRATDEEQCLLQIRQLLSYLPQNNAEKPARYDCMADPNTMIESLNALVPSDPRMPYDMRDLIGSIADGADFFEVQPLFAQNIITGFMRLDGQSVGVIANQPRVMAGCLDIDASDKASRFIRTCDAFNIPLLTLVDVPGFLPGTQQEYGGIIRHGAKMLFAYSEATVPKVTLIVRKAYGGAYIGMCSKHLGGDLVLAWPDAEIAVMGAEGAANIIFSREIRDADNPQEKRNEKIDEYTQEMMNPYIAAARGYIDDVIMPEETRQRLISSFSVLEGKRSQPIPKKHGNIPL
ncbi:MAG: methylmalonyl-CoA carboxyltransferase [Clostridiaceae bacterium]|nr:methylmalonyl-CoA carboxyltransferase [Clostridiaceae bacterium]